MRRNYLPAPPQLPDGLMYDINPGSDEVVPADFIQLECANALCDYDAMLEHGKLDWDHYKNDPSYWWRKRNG